MASQDEGVREVLGNALVDSGLDSLASSLSSSSEDLSVSGDAMRRSLEMWERKRATLLLRIFATLDSTQKTCLGGILSFKAKVS